MEARALLLVGVVGVWSAACSSTAATPGGDGAIVTTVDACSWPAALAQTDSSSGQCRGAARAVLSCTDTVGAGVICVTNDTQCDTSGTNFAGPLTCENKCGPTEFGLVCGHIGPGDQVTPPPTCRAVVVTPGGIVFYCCPCGL